MSQTAFNAWVVVVGLGLSIGVWRLCVAVRRLQRWTQYKEEWAACGHEKAPGTVCGATLTEEALIALKRRRRRQTKRSLKKTGGHKMQGKKPRYE